MFTSLLFNEKKPKIFAEILSKIGKEIFLNILGKVLEVENKGGMTKYQNEKNKDKDSDLYNNNTDYCDSNGNLRKTSGGVFLSFVKKNENISKAIKRDIFRKDYQSQKEKKKIIKLINNLSI